MRLDDRSIRRLRAPKPAVNPWRPHGVLDETERIAGGGTRSCRTVFLAGAECPFSCVFCDLWRFTTDGPTPPGAVPHQLDFALEDRPSHLDCLKLYNASNFFDPRAVPPSDHEAIARRAKGFERLVVECHPKLVGQSCRDFAKLISPSLEIGLGLETVHPESLARLNKKMNVDDFSRACDFALRSDVAVRAFVLIGAPFVPALEALEWIDRSVRFAVSSGVSHVALIPLRPGNGALESLAAEGEFAMPDLPVIEEALALGLAAETAQATVSLDLWEIERHARTSCCAPRRIRRLREMNSNGRISPAIECQECEGGTT